MKFRRCQASITLATSKTMADKGEKRQVFDMPVSTDSHEIIDVFPLFNRLKETHAQENSSNRESSSEQETLDVGVSNLKDAKKLNADCLTLSVCCSNKKFDVVSKDLPTEQELKGSKFFSTTCENQSSVTNPGQEIPAHPSNPNAIIVSKRQKGNPVLKFFRNVPWEYGDVIPDYVMGYKMCALFLSTRYHNFNPDYIHERLKQLGNRYELRVLLVQVDTKDPHKSLKELTKMAILADFTLILAWSPEEAARYIEMYKIYENKPPDVLQGQTSNDFISQLTDCLTTVKSVNKTDAVTVLSTFESLENVARASIDEISLCPGFGPQKAKRLHNAFHQPFIASKTSIKQGSDE